MINKKLRRIIKDGWFSYPIVKSPMWELMEGKNLNHPNATINAMSEEELREFVKKSISWMHGLLSSDFGHMGLTDAADRRRKKGLKRVRDFEIAHELIEAIIGKGAITYPSTIRSFESKNPCEECKARIKGYAEGGMAKMMGEVNAEYYERAKIRNTFEFPRCMRNLEGENECYLAPLGEYSMRNVDPTLFFPDSPLAMGKEMEEEK